MFTSVKCGSFYRFIPLWYFGRETPKKRTWECGRTKAKNLHSVVWFKGCVGATKINRTFWQRGWPVPFLVSDVRVLVNVRAVTHSLPPSCVLLRVGRSVGHHVVGGGGHSLHSWLVPELDLRALSARGVCWSNEGLIFSSSLSDWTGHRETNLNQTTEFPLCPLAL